MYGLTRAITTLIGAALAGFLLWLAVEFVEGEESAGDYWSSVGLVALAGLVMALSQLLGGWTKWGWPRISAPVFLIAFLPVLIVGFWLVLAGQPEGEGWLRGDVLNWSDDIGIGGVVDQLLFVLPVIVFGIGLVFGFTFDTSGPRIATVEPVGTVPSAHEPVVERRTDDDETAVEAPPRAPG
jgi:hypothetical protein